MTVWSAGLWLVCVLVCVRACVCVCWCKVPAGTVSDYGVAFPSSSVQLTEPSHLQLSVELKIRAQSI